MAAAYPPDHKKSKLADLFRSPFRSNSIPAEESDWYIPYNGPVEPPRPGSLTNPQYSDHNVSPSKSHVAPSFRTESTTRDSGSRRGTVSKPGSKVTYLSLDTGGIGESPASIVENATIPRKSSTANLFHLHSKDRSLQQQQPSSPQLPAAQPRTAPGTLRHPFNPHGFDSFTFPSHPNQRPPASPTLAAYRGLPSSTFQTSSPVTPGERHPYSTNSPTSVVHSPRVEAAWASHNTAPRARSSTMRSNVTINPEPTVISPSDRLSPTLPRGRVMSSSEGIQPPPSLLQPRNPVLSKSRSNPQSLSTAAAARGGGTTLATSPTYPMHSHPYALSPPTSSNNKPPIPLKSEEVMQLQRLRSATSTPNLRGRSGSTASRTRLPSTGPGAGAHTTTLPSRRAPPPPRIDISHHPHDGLQVHTGMVHEFPMALAPVSQVGALFAPKPSRFVAAYVTPIDSGLPRSPYSLARPTDSDLDTDRGMLNQCLPKPGSGYRGKYSYGLGTDLGVPPADRARRLLMSRSTPALHTQMEKDRDQAEDPFDSSKTSSDTDRERERKRREDESIQALRDNKLLSAEREMWARTAKDSWGNKRSRSLSTRGKAVVRRSVSHGALNDEAGIAVRARSTVNVNAVPPRANENFNRLRSRTISREQATGIPEHHLNPPSTSHHRPTDSGETAVGSLPVTGRSLRYLASAAFGHGGHSPKISVDTSNSGSGTGGLGTASTRSSANVGKHSGSAGRRSNHTHSRGSSVETRPFSAASSHVPIVAVTVPPPEPKVSVESSDDAEVVDIRSVRNTMMDEDVDGEADADGGFARAAVEQRIGLAFSSPPPTPDPILPSRGNAVHPYASPTAVAMSSSIVAATRAGPHPTSPVQGSPIEGGSPIKDDVGSRHRLPPQVVQAHKRSMSGGPNALAPGPPAAPTPSLLKIVPPPPPTSYNRTPITPPSSTDSPSHPFLAGRINKERPSSGQVERSFEDALLASSALAEWPPFAAQLRERGDSVATVTKTIRPSKEKEPSPVEGPVILADSAASRSRRNTFGTQAGHHNNSNPSSPVQTTTPSRNSFGSPTESRGRGWKEGLEPVPRTPRLTRRRSRSVSEMTSADGKAPAHYPPLGSYPPNSVHNGGHARSASQPLLAMQASASQSRPSLSQEPNGSFTPPTESSIVSSVNPEIVFQENEDLSEFRDLFYRPRGENGTSVVSSSIRSSLIADSDAGAHERRESGNSLQYWGILSPALGSPGIGEPHAAAVQSPMSPRSVHDRREIAGDSKYLLYVRSL